MHRLIFLILVLFLFACSEAEISTDNYPKISTDRQIFQKGIATWYGPNFHGRKTSSGDIYDMYCFTAAHLTMPLQTIIRVTNIKNNRTVIVRVNDRGPVNKNLILDLSKIAATNLDIPRKGSGTIEIEILGQGDNPMKKIFDVYRNLGNQDFKEKNI